MRPDLGFSDLLVTGPTELYVARGADGTIEAQPKVGGEPRLVARIGAPVLGLSFAGDALWLTTGHSIERISTKGGAAQILSDKLVRPHAIAADGTWVFVVNVGGASGGLLRASAVVRVAASGGDPTVLGRYEGEVTNVALDADSAYWADRLDGTIVSAAKVSGATKVLASDRGLPGQVVVAGDMIAWVEKRSESLWAMPKAGGGPKQLEQDFAGFSRVVVLHDAIAWTGEAPVDGVLRILSVPAAGGEVSPLGPAVDAIDAIASDGTTLFWLRDGVASAVPAAN